MKQSSGRRQKKAITFPPLTAREMKHTHTAKHHSTYQIINEGHQPSINQPTTNQNVFPTEYQYES
jgi:hypothetical protein